MSRQIVGVRALPGLEPEQQPAFATRLSDPTHPASEEGLPALLALCPDAMVIVDCSGAIVLLNAQTERLFGYRHGELVGKPIELLVPERLRGRHGVHRERYGADPHARPMGVGLELYGRRKDGSEFPVEISLSPLETESRRLVSSAIRDITARKQAEEDASHYTAVVESSHDAIVGKDLEGVITSWNGGAERLYGYRSPEARGKSISILVPAGHDDELPELLMRVRAGERVDDYETVRVRKDGTLVDV
jgi:PAS domain S-box-containing protein